MKSTLLLAALSCVPFTAPAQEKTAPAASTTGIHADGVTFTLPEGKVGIEELIDAAARFLGRNILTNPAELAGAGQGSSFVLHKPVAVDAAGCEELLYNLLYTKGFAVVPIDPDKGFYEVVAMAGPRGRELTSRPTKRSAEAVLRRPDFKEYVLVAVPLQHINATIATNALRPFFASGGGGMAGSSLTLGNVGNNTSILLQGFGDQVAAAIRLLQECDKSAPVEPPALQERVAALEATVARLQAQLEALQKGR